MKTTGLNSKKDVATALEVLSDIIDMYTDSLYDIHAEVNGEQISEISTKICSAVHLRDMLASFYEEFDTLVATTGATTARTSAVYNFDRLKVGDQVIIEKDHPGLERHPNGCTRMQNAMYMYNRRNGTKIIATRNEDGSYTLSRIE